MKSRPSQASLCHGGAPRKPAARRAGRWLAAASVVFTLSGMAPQARASAGGGAQPDAQTSGAGAQPDAAQAGASGASPSTAAPAGAPAAPPSFASAGPFALSATVVTDLIGNPVGGIATGLKVLTKTAVVASYDGNRSDHPGWTALVSAQYVKGGHISGANVGDLQHLDNIEAVNGLRLYEAWVARAFGNGTAGVKLGLTDLNVDFDTQQVAALFINSSDGVGAELGSSGLNGPSIYPTTALAFSGFYKPDAAWTLRAGLFDGVAGSPSHPGAFVAVHLSGEDGALAIVQAERTMGQGARVVAGGWAYTGGFDALHELTASGDPRRLRRARGAFTLIEGPLREGGDRGPALSGWVRAGLGDLVVERISFYIGAGLVASQLIAGRPEDQAGIAVHRARVDDSSLPDTVPGTRRAETEIELTYRAQVKDWLQVQPDMQFVAHANGSATIPQCLGRRPAPDGRSDQGQHPVHLVRGQVRRSVSGQVAQR